MEADRSELLTQISRLQSQNSDHECNAVIYKNKIDNLQTQNSKLESKISELELRVKIAEDSQKNKMHRNQFYIYTVIPVFCMLVTTFFMIIYYFMSANEIGSTDIANSNQSLAEPILPEFCELTLLRIDVINPPFLVPRPSHRPYFREEGM